MHTKESLHLSIKPGINFQISGKIKKYLDLYYDIGWFFSAFSAKLRCEVLWEHPYSLLSMYKTIFIGY